MHRQPSIHVTEEKLKELLKKHFGSWVSDYMISQQVKHLILDAKKYQLSGRKLLSTSKKITQKANIISKSPLEHAMQMAKAIYMFRKSEKHRGIEIAKPNSRDFTIIKTITAHALEFADEFNIPVLNAAFQNYLQCYKEIIGKQGKFHLITLQNKVEAIHSHFRAKIDSTNDRNKEYTLLAYQTYNQFVIKGIGELLTDYAKVPDKYQYFIQVAAECKRLKLSPTVYIKAQFEGLAWTKGIPEPAQLVGPKALERLQKYLFAHAEDKDEPKVNKQNVNSLKNLKKLR